MESRRHVLGWLAVMAVFGAGTAAAQTFNSGSTGADGDLNVTADTTLPLPADGVFHYRTVNIAAGATLRFTRNALNTPVHILATGDIDVAGTISLDGLPGSLGGTGEGGPGGFDGGSGGGAGLPPGDGHGPGGGRAGDADSPPGASAEAGSGAYGGRPQFSGAADGQTYGSALLIPLAGGSGGGGGTGNPGPAGGGGGGAVLLASNTRVTVTGSVLARGGSNFRDQSFNCGFNNQGSGGAIRIVAPVVSGTGALSVSGGAVNTHQECGARDRGGSGRIRIDTYDRRGAQFNLTSGVTSYGTVMIAVPATLPHLDIVQVATQNIPVGSDAVEFTLPLGSAALQPVRVRATNFTGMVPIRIDLVPDNGSKVTQDAMIDATGNPAEVTVNMSFPVNVRTRVEVYTR